MRTFDTLDTTIIIAMAIVYSLATGWLTAGSMHLGPRILRGTLARARGARGRTSRPGT